MRVVFASYGVGATYEKVFHQKYGFAVIFLNKHRNSRSMLISRFDLSTDRKVADLDVKDKRVLQLLAADARAPLTVIAKEVKLSRDAVDYRIKRLQEQGVIRACVPHLDFERLGFYTFHVFLLLDDMHGAEQDALIAYLSKHPNVRSIIEYSDRWDLEIVLLARSLQEFDGLVLDIAGRFPDIILEKDKVEIIKQYGHTAFPQLLVQKEKPNGVVAPHGECAIDVTDLAILRDLALDCRASTYDIAARVKVSSDTVAYRIKQLVANGVIRRFTVIPDLTLLGLQWYTYTIETKMFDATSEAKLESYLETDRSVIRSAKTLGGWDLLLYIAAPGPREFHKTVRALKGLFPHIVRNYQAWIGYREHVLVPVPGCVLSMLEKKAEKSVVKKTIKKK